jgi:hypothetical protein
VELDELGLLDVDELGRVEPFDALDVVDALGPLDRELVVEPPEMPEVGALLDAVLPLEPVVALVELDADPLDVTPLSAGLELQALPSQGTVASAATRQKFGVLRMLMQVREQWQHSRNSVAKPRAAAGPLESCCVGGRAGPRRRRGAVLAPLRAYRRTW